MGWGGGGDGGAVETMFMLPFLMLFYNLLIQTGIIKHSVIGSKFSAS